MLGGGSEQDAGRIAGWLRLFARLQALLGGRVSKGGLVLETGV